MVGYDASYHMTCAVVLLQNFKPFVAVKLSGMPKSEAVVCSCLPEVQYEP